MCGIVQHNAEISTKKNADIHQHFFLLTTYYKPKPISCAVLYLCIFLK